MFVFSRWWFVPSPAAGSFSSFSPGWQDYHSTGGSREQLDKVRKALPTTVGYLTAMSRTISWFIVHEAMPLGRPSAFSACTLQQTFNATNVAFTMCFSHMYDTYNTSTRQSIIMALETGWLDKLSSAMIFQCLVCLLMCRLQQTLAPW